MATNQDNLTAMTTINDITDLVQILQERPEWLQVFRCLVIGEELAQVPQRLDILDQRLAEFIEFVKENTAAMNHRLEALEAHNRFMGSSPDPYGRRDNRHTARPGYLEGLPNP